MKFKRTSWTNRSDPTGGRTSSSLPTPGGLVIHAGRPVGSGQSGSASVKFLSGRTRKCIVGLRHSKRSAPAKFRTKTKANSEQRHSSILFCLRPILLPIEYWRCTAILGLVLDSSVLIAAERRKLTPAQVIEDVVETVGTAPIILSALTVAEIGHGIYRANTPEIRERRRAFLDELGKGCALGCALDIPA